MKNNLNWALTGICIIITAAILGSAYKYKYHAQDTIVVTGLGEKEFTSDLIVWRDWIVQQSPSAEAGYAQLESAKRKVQEFIRSKGIADSSVVFQFVNVNRTTEPIYANGQYIGQRNTGYELRQEFTVESKDIARVETVSREISSLIAQGVQIESWQPEYYYTKLADVKMDLIAKATEDANLRARTIAKKAGSRLKKLRTARMGVFQITSPNSNEAFTAGGTFNTSSKNKIARITMRLEYHIK